MSSERRLRLRGNTIKPPAEKPVLPEGKPQVNVLVHNFAEGDLREVGERTLFPLREQMQVSRRLASNAPLPSSMSMSLDDLEGTYGMPSRQWVHLFSSERANRYRGYSEANFPELRNMQAELFHRPRAVDYLLSINHQTWLNRPMTCEEDVFLVMAGLLAYCSHDNIQQRTTMALWVRDACRMVTFQRCPNLINDMRDYALCATLGSLPSEFFSSFSPSR